MTEHDFLRMAYSDRKGCSGPLYLAALIVAVLILFTGCKTVKSTESEREYNRISSLTDRMDSLFKSTATWQQSIYEKQTSLIDSIREKEKNDSSHTVIINEKGDTIKETIIIERVIEKEHSTDSKESETTIQLQSRIDSLVRLTVENKELTDSLLKERNKETVIEKQPTWWQKVTQKIGGYAIGCCCIFIIIFIGFIASRLRRKIS